VCNTFVNEIPAHLERRGFTLIELLLVISIIGLLAAIGLANFVSLQKRARFAACISNQKHVHEAAIIYSSDVLVGTQNINVNVLTGAGLITQKVGECPSSGTVDFDDYLIQYTNNEVTQIACSILGAEHRYAP
jgi:prepilin-type N-terminal cleavage/methylation domain-containing protein